MKFIKLLLILTIAITACKSNKAVVENSESLKKMTARKIVKKYEDNKFTANTLDSKIKVRYTNYRGDKRKRFQFTVRLRMKKDSIIWMKVTKVVTAYKIKITPKSFSFYSPVEKEYFEGNYELLEDLLGVKVTFSQLQNLLVGRSILDMKDQKFKSEIDGNSYKLTPRNQQELFDVFFRINPRHFRLDQMYLTKTGTDRRLRVDYGNYTVLEDNYFPLKTIINAYEGERYTWVDMRTRSLTLNKPVNVHYKIPSGYKRIHL
ncbi:DUF4292 domain-containing protein [Pseudotenacibaculum sp. MALMAid0570]|uniref:DUF4292 domain-containing protein n=1 Tax=Pseudotenacibaculum sp. MALMAid0570 TaxID=3143938 RepID=UPI0032E05012